MTPKAVTVYRHRTWHPKLSQYTDTGHDTQSCHSKQTQDIPLCHSIQTQDMTPKAVTVYRRRAWHPKLSQYTDAGHDTQSCHSIQTQGMTPKAVTVYRHRAWHPKLSQYTDAGWGPTFRCPIHLCGTSHWKPQQSILMCWIWPDREILPNLPHVHVKPMLYFSALTVVFSEKLTESVPYHLSYKPASCGMHIQ